MKSNILSKERIIATTIQILDAEGEAALTFRTLAERLATGPGAIYYHVANKDELLATAANSLITQARNSVTGCEDPRDEIRAVSLALFDVVEVHPWIGSAMSNDITQMGTAQFFEAAGSKLGALGVPLEDQFNVASALAIYISGVATQNSASARLIAQITSQGMDRMAFLTQLAEQWQQFDAEEFPFVRQIAATFSGHDDREQFLAGIDLILAGIGRL